MTKNIEEQKHTSFNTYNMSIAHPPIIINPNQFMFKCMPQNYLFQFQDMYKGYTNSLQIKLPYLIDKTTLLNIFLFYGKIEHIDINAESLGDYLSILSNYRNLCAHEDIVYEHRTQTYIGDTYYHSRLNIPKNDLGEYTKGKNDLFALIIILKQVLQADRFKEFIQEINTCFDMFNMHINTIEINKLYNKMGFPENYMDIVDIRGGLDE